MGDWNSTVPTILSGDAPSGDTWKLILDQLTTLAGAWTPYTPTWTASAGTPDIGNGTLAGRYNRVGKMLDFVINLTAGTTTTFGTVGAAFRFTIPSGFTVAFTHTGSGLFLDASAGNQRYPLMWHIDSSANLLRLWRTSANFELANDAPVTMATSDAIQFSGRVELN